MHSDDQDVAVIIRVRCSSWSTGRGGKGAGEGERQAAPKQTAWQQQGLRRTTAHSSSQRLDHSWLLTGRAREGRKSREAGC